MIVLGAYNLQQHNSHLVYRTDPWKGWRPDPPFFPVTCCNTTLSRPREGERQHPGTWELRSDAEVGNGCTFPKKEQHRHAALPLLRASVRPHLFFPLYTDILEWEGSMS